MTTDFKARAKGALRELFDRARSANPVQFAMALIQEFRGSQDPGWCAWQETQLAFKEFSEFLEP
jgi:hypothetical protein